MKSIIILLIMLVPFFGSAQQKRAIKKPIPLDIGQKLPDIPLGQVMDNSGKVSSAYQGKTKFSQFKGKLVILDHWATYCGPCIEGFEKLSKLQEEFKDQIQIFLVNVAENDVVIRNWLTVQNKNRSGENIVPANLPMIAYATELRKLFPVRGETGYHVWIGKQGNIILRGIHENTHKEKILQYLTGKQVSFVQDNALAYNSKYPYARTLINPNELQSMGSSFFGGFNDVLANSYGASAEDIIDSLNKTKRNTYLNLSIVELYQNAFNTVLEQDSNVVFGRRIILDAKDKSLYTTDPDWVGNDLTEESYQKSGYCYEQIVPLSATKSLTKAYMQEDLNRYFGLKRNAHGGIETKKVVCYRLEQLSNRRSPQRSNQPVSSRYGQSAEGKRKKIYMGERIREIIRSYFQNNHLFNRDEIVIDNTQLDYPIDLALTPINDLKSIEQLRIELQGLGFDLVKSEDMVRYLIIKEN